jgi:hypothetical protein
VFFGFAVWSRAAEIKWDELPAKTGEWERRPFEKKKARIVIRALKNQVRQQYFDHLSEL